VTDNPGPDIRTISFKDYVTLGINRYAFGKSPEKPDLEKALAREKYAGQSIALAAYEDGEAQASCGVHVFTANIRGKLLTMGGIGGVASLPAGRRKGHVRNLLTHSFGLMREQGQPVSALYPFRDSFYERLGYAEFPKNRFTTLKPEQLAPLLRMSFPGIIEQRGIEDCFDEWWAFQQRYQADVHGYALAERTRAEQSRDTNEFWVALVREDGEITGAMTFTITGYTEALVASTFQATTATAHYQLLAWIGRHVDQVSEAVIELPADAYPELWYRDLAAQTSTVHKHAWPGPMGRVVDVAGLDGIGAGDGRVSVTLVDDQCPWNNGAWTLTGEGGHLAVRAGGDPTCHLTIQGLAALVWCGMDPATFAWRGWGDPGEADQTSLRTLFPRAFPQLNEKF